VHFVIVTGVSGAGKTTALKALEDLGFYCSDNLPLPLLSRFVEVLAAPRAEPGRAALGIDARSGESLGEAEEVLAAIRAAGHTVDVLFFDAPDAILLRRYSETRRRHPLSGTDVQAGLNLERGRLAWLRREATVVVETGDLTVHELRARVQERYAGAERKLAVAVESFGFRNGLPSEADVVLDVRFLPNPHYVERLRPLSGRDEPVRRYVLDQPEAQQFLERAEALLRLMLAGFEREGKTYATLAIGCTGGRHRSVAIAEELARRIDGDWSARVRHRDLDRPEGG